MRIIKEAVYKFAIFFAIVLVWNYYQDSMTVNTVHEALNWALALSMASELLEV